MIVHLVDGTYELFRYHFALPSHLAGDREVAATRGVAGTILQLLEGGATHVGVATDHVIESFRNDLWAGYKDGSGVDPDLAQQFPLIEDVLRALGVTVFPMVEFEADDALGAAARVAAAEALGLPDSDHRWAEVEGELVLPRLRERMYSQLMWAQNMLMPWVWRHTLGSSRMISNTSMGNPDGNA